MIRKLQESVTSNIKCSKCECVYVEETMGGQHGSRERNQRPTSHLQRANQHSCIFLKGINNLDKNSIDVDPEATNMEVGWTSHRQHASDLDQLEMVTLRALGAQDPPAGKGRPRRRLA